MFEEVVTIKLEVGEITGVARGKNRSVTLTIPRDLKENEMEIMGGVVVRAIVAIISDVTAEDDEAEPAPKAKSAAKKTAAK